MLDRNTYIANLAHDGAALLTIASANMSAPVFACPGWTVGDLVWHIGEVHFSWAHIVADGITDPGAIQNASRPQPSELLPWATEQLEYLLGVIASVEADRPIWTWAGDATAAWVARRMAHETAMHALDAHAALGRQFEIDSRLASDGIDEFLALYLPFHKDDAPVLDGSVHIHCTDVDGEWLIVPGDAMTLTVTREHAKGSCAIRGAARDILAALWRREPLTQIEVIGDMDVAARFVARTSLD